jgi:ubiquinone/menaquinone biosynthesis C-methylase UbiE
MLEIKKDAWDSAQSYEQYVGRWSRHVADSFLRWLDLPSGLDWVDIGCGTGALMSNILSLQNPTSVFGIDMSMGFLSQTRDHLQDPRVTFTVGDAAHLPWKAAIYDASVSGLVLNFVGDPDAMVCEMVRVTRPGGWVAVYVWDYAGGMQMMRHFWDAAVSVYPNVAVIDEGERFPLCQPEPLQRLFERNQLKSISVEALEIPTVFKDFDDYWRPFLGGTGSAPTYLTTLSEAERESIRQILESSLASDPDRLIEMTARAWAVRGMV